MMKRYHVVGTSIILSLCWEGCAKPTKVQGTNGRPIGQRDGRNDVMRDMLIALLIK